MRSITVTTGPYAAGNAALYAASQAPTIGTGLTLTGTKPDLPRRVLLTFGNDVTTSRTFKLAGTNGSGDLISEVMTIPSGSGTQVSVLDYATVTAATPTGTGWSANVSLGTVTTGGASPIASSAWARLDDYGFANTAIGVDVTGTANYTVESSDDDPNLVLPQIAVAPSAMTWVGHNSLTSLTVAQHDGYTYTPRWVRLTLNSATATSGSASMVVTQPGGKLG